MGIYTDLVLNYQGEAKVRNSKMKWAICDCCEGHGKVEHPAFSNGFTSSEWADMSEDEHDSYMRGDYDVKCEACDGLGRVEVPNVAEMTFAEKRALVEQRREARLDAKIDREIAAEYAAERRMGC